MPLRDYFWCTLIAINGVFLFTDSGALLFTDHTSQNKSIKNISVQSTEKWMEKVIWRKANRDWLRKSSEVALRILDALDDLGWNKARLAKELGVSPQQVSKYVKGEENFKIETLCKLEKVLGIELITVLQSDQVVRQRDTSEYKENEKELFSSNQSTFSDL
jgi:ribosome-binding protein aMBF1 (putative translation factor)